MSRSLGETLDETAPILRPHYEVDPRNDDVLPMAGHQTQLTRDLPLSLSGPYDRHTNFCSQG
jgi:hypothetical protein